MSFVKKLIKQSSTYMVGEILIMIGGLISFPIFTRLLTKHEYGVMNLISITLGLVEEFSSMGIRHAVNRFYSSYGTSEQRSAFYSTTLFSSLFFGFVGTMVTVIVCNILADFGILDKSVSSLFTIAALLIVTRVMMKVIGHLFRMREKAKTYTFFAILTKYLGMGMSIILVSVYLLGIKGFFTGLILGEIVSLVLLVTVMMKEFGAPVLNCYSRPILREMCVYGFPIILSVIPSMCMLIGDRYLIGWFISAEAVAVYSVPYNLCSYILSIFVTGFEFAFFPLIMNEWKEGEHEKARQGLVKVIRIYCMCAIPVIFGVSALGERLITTIASNKYAEASYILPYIITGEMITGISTPLMMGFVFMQKSGMIMKYRSYGAIANILLNLMLIPIFGLRGAAVATLCSYLFFVVVGCRESFKYFYIPIPYFVIAKYCICSAGMFVLIKALGMFLPKIGLVAMIPAGVAIYSISLILVDKEVRSITMLGFLSFYEKFR